MSASLHALRHKRLVYMKRRERITDAIQRDYAITAITVRDYARLRRLRDYAITVTVTTTPISSARVAASDRLR
jgi:hypothetical protein